MAQQFQGGGITYDQGAAVRQNAQILQQSMSGLAGQMNQNKMRFLEEYKAREQAFMAKAQASGIPLDAYILGPGAQEYSQLIGARNNLGRIFGQGQQAQQGAAAGEMSRINENISPAAMGYAAQQEAMRRGLPESGMVPTYAPAPAQAPAQAPVAAPAQAATPVAATPSSVGQTQGKQPTTSAFVKPVVDQMSPGMEEFANVRGFTATNPVTLQPLLGTDGKPMLFQTMDDASLAVATTAKGALEGELGKLSFDQTQRAKAIVPDAPVNPKFVTTTPPTAADAARGAAAKSDAIRATDVSATGSRSGLYANAPQTSTQARMADKQMAAKEAKANEAAPAAEALVERVVTGEKVDTKTAMKGFAAAKQIGNYFDNIKQVPDNELQAMVAKWKNDVNNMTPEELELAGMSNVANRRAMSQQLEAAANLELMKAKIMAGAEQGQASSKLAEQAVKAIEALQKMESDIPELMKAQGIKNRADFMAKNPDYEANLKSARTFASQLTGIKIPEFTAIPSGLFFWQKGKFVPADTMSAYSGATGNSAVEDAWAAMQ